MTASVPIFVLSCKKGYEDRRRSIDSQMQRYALSYQYVLEWDRPEIDEEISSRYFVAEMPVSLKSPFLKHLTALQRAIESNRERVLILEDDVILEKNFPARFQTVLEESLGIRNDHVVYLSNYGNRYTPRSKRRPHQTLYPNDHSRAADSYLITLGACKKRLLWFQENRASLAIDHQLNRIDQAMGVDIYWAEDPLIEQGSENGTFHSAVHAKHSVLKKKIRWQLDKFYKKHLLRNLR